MIHESFYLINSAAVNNIRNTNRSKNDRPVSACMLTSTGCANGGTWEREGERERKPISYTTSEV